MAKLVTHDNAILDLELATVGDRVVAFLINLFLMGAYTLAFVAISYSMGLDEMLQMKFLIPLFFYSLSFEMLLRGQSPGKRFRKIQVVRLDGSSPSFGNYVLRWLFRLIDVFAFYGIVGMLVIANSKNNQRIGDMVAGTCMIKLRDESIGQIVAPIAPSRESFSSVLSLNDDLIEQLKIAIDLHINTNEDIALLAKKLKVKLNVVSEVGDLDFLKAVIVDYESKNNE
ncbi:MAG: RDD family protein [Cytophagales bacterium]|nr:RDD family protein [Cytophagales bacterium]